MNIDSAQVIERNMSLGQLFYCKSRFKKFLNKEGQL